MGTFQQWSVPIGTLILEYELAAMKIARGRLAGGALIQHVPTGGTVLRTMNIVFLWEHYCGTEREMVLWDQLDRRVN
jgi:hypothetical protein